VLNAQLAGYDAAIVYSTMGEALVVMKGQNGKWTHFTVYLAACIWHGAVV